MQSFTWNRVKWLNFIRYLCRSKIVFIFLLPLFKLPLFKTLCTKSSYSYQKNQKKQIKLLQNFEIFELRFPLVNWSHFRYPWKLKSKKWKVVIFTGVKKYLTAVAKKVVSFTDVTQMSVQKVFRGFFGVTKKLNFYSKFNNYCVFPNKIMSQRCIT